MEIVISEACNGFWNCLSPDAWLTAVGTLVGAFLGASLAGSYAVYSVRKQLLYDKNNREKHEIESILKESISFLSSLKAYIDMCKETEKDILNSDEEISRKTMLGIIAFYNTIDTAIEDLNTTNLRVLPYEEHKKYGIVIKRIKSSSLNFAMIINSLQKQNKKSEVLEYLSEIQAHLEELEIKYDEINTFINNQKKAIKKFK